MASLMVIYTIWLREFKIFTRERSRIVLSFVQPLLYLVVLGKGITAGMRLNVAGNVDYLKFMYPGIIGMSILFTSIFAAISIIWDREFGFMKEVLVAPVPRWGVAVGKSLGGATVAMFQSAILIVLAPFVGVTLSIAIVVKLLVLAFLMSFAVTSLGVAVAARMASMQGFQAIMNLLVLPLYFLSGAMFPIATAPAWMKALMTADPLFYGVDGIRNVIFGKTMIATAAGELRPLIEIARSTGLVRWPLMTDLAVMIGVAIVLTIFGAWSFNRAQAA